jgi:hypothetical protein
MAPARSGAAHEAVRIVLWATCAKAELIGRLQPILGDRLTVVANAGELEAAIGECRRAAVRRFRLQRAGGAGGA